MIIAFYLEHASGKAIVERSRALICAESPWIAEHQRDSVLVHRRSRVVGRLMLAASYEHNIKATAGEEQAHESGKGRRITSDQRRSDQVVSDRRAPPPGEPQRGARGTATWRE